MESTDKGIPFSNLIIIIASGILFGLGLSVSEMVNPARVLGFLNILGPWDPTLIFVMGGALTVAVPGFQYARLMHKPVLGMSFSMPGKKDLDKKLILGAVLFGIGWGLAGI
ncbi:MAG: YeeE/YedE family protein, partial [Gammaproteobacteria bacterium]|nr:YeeE/YedE family protein [Gammaproteobacteria bacterium]